MMAINHEQGHRAAQLMGMHIEHREAALLDSNTKASGPVKYSRNSLQGPLMRYWFPTGRPDSAQQNALGQLLCKRGLTNGYELS